MRELYQPYSPMIIQKQSSEEHNGRKQILGTLICKQESRNVLLAPYTDDECQN